VEGYIDVPYEWESLRVCIAFLSHLLASHADWASWLYCKAFQCRRSV